MTLPPERPLLEAVTSPAQAIALLCRERPLEFRLVPGTLTELINADPPQVASATMLLLESGHGASWGSTGVWLHPATFNVRVLPDWAMCEPVASFLDELDVDHICGASRKHADNQRHFWAIYANRKPPIMVRSFSPSASAAMAYAELIRQWATA